jgi:hypothetical protein
MSYVAANSKQPAASHCIVGRARHVIIATAAVHALLCLQSYCTDTSTSTLLYARLLTPHAHTTQPRHRVRSGEFDLSGKHVRLGWGSTTTTSTSTTTTTTSTTSDSSKAHSLAATRAPLPRLRMDKPGSRVYELVPLDAATVGTTVGTTVAAARHSAAAAMAGPVVEEAWQNQRFDNIKRRWRGTSAANGDRPEWSTKVTDSVQRLANGFCNGSPTAFVTAIATVLIVAICQDDYSAMCIRIMV